MSVKGGGNRGGVGLGFQRGNTELLVEEEGKVGRASWADTRLSFYQMPRIETAEPFQGWGNDVPEACILNPAKTNNCF